MFTITRLQLLDRICGKVSRKIRSPLQDAINLAKFSNVAAFGKETTRRNERDTESIFGNDIMPPRKATPSVLISPRLRELFVSFYQPITRNLALRILNFTGSWCLHRCDGLLFMQNGFQETPRSWTVWDDGIVHSLEFPTLRSGFCERFSTVSPQF